MTKVLAMFMAFTLMVPLAPAYADLVAGSPSLDLTLEKENDGGPAAVITADPSGKLVIGESGKYLVRGAGTTPIAVVDGAQVEIALSNASIDARGTSSPALSLADGTSAAVRIIGECSLVGDVNRAALQVARDAALSIEGDARPCSLSAAGNAGIDYHDSAGAKAAGNTNGAGIGGAADAPDAGPISVDGNGTLELSASGGGVGAAGIGSAYGGSANGIALVATLLADVRGGCQDAAVEGDESSAKSSLEGGPAIGGGTKGASAGPIVIRGCTGEAIVGGSKSAGVGGGCWAHDVSVEIADSTLQVEGGLTGAAIGAGRADTGTAADVRISNSAVRANGGLFAAGIGLGANGSNRELGISRIAISASDITATGGAGAAGIGGGVRGYNVNVSIEGGSHVEARAGANYLAKYTEKYNGASDTVTPDGGIGQSGAAGIGRGAWGSVTKFWNLEQAAAPAFSLSADSELLALSSGDNWAIAGFLDTDGVAAPVLQARFCRNYDLADQGIDTQDAEEGSEPVCYLDGERATGLTLRRAGTLESLAEVTLPAVDAHFANGYNGAGRLGYYAVALTVPEAESYQLATQSPVRTSMAAGDELIDPLDERYLGGASFRNDGGASNVFDCAAGISSYDRVAFREQAAFEDAPTATESSTDAMPLPPQSEDEPGEPTAAQPEKVPTADPASPQPAPRTMPQTGDTLPIGIFALLAAVSLLIIALLLK